MKKLWGGIGTMVFWLLWPFWVVYFRYHSKRSRVLVVCDNEILLVQNWIGTKKYNLPGGGNHTGERPQDSALRELREETGIVSTETALIKLGLRRNKYCHINHHATFFSLVLARKPDLKLRRPEIFSVAWVPIDQIDTSFVDDEAIYAIKRYKPMEQGSLL